jgi:hypothetical protein
LIQFLQCSAYLNFQVNLATEKQANNKSFQIKSHSKRGKNYSITDSKQINIQICKWNSKWKILVNRSGYFGGLTTETWKDLGWWSHLWSNQTQYSHFEVFFPYFWKLICKIDVTILVEKPRIWFVQSIIIITFILIYYWLNLIFFPKMKE